MFEAFHEGSSNGAGVGHARRRNYVQCGQCTENFPKTTMVCPRCGRKNDRSPFVICLQFLVVVIFVCTVNWVVRASASRGGENPIVENAEFASQLEAATAVANAQADVKF